MITIQLPAKSATPNVPPVPTEAQRAARDAEYAAAEKRQEEGIKYWLAHRQNNPELYK